MIPRENGANPLRTRRCNWGVMLRNATVLGWEGEADVKIQKPEDLSHYIEILTLGFRVMLLLLFGRATPFWRKYAIIFAISAADYICECGSE